MYSVSIILPCQRFVASPSVTYGSMIMIWKDTLSISYRLEVLRAFKCLQEDDYMLGVVTIKLCRITTIDVLYN